MIGVGVAVTVGVSSSIVGVNSIVGKDGVKVDASVGGIEVDVGEGSGLFKFEITGIRAATIVANAPIKAMIMP